MGLPGEMFVLGKTALWWNRVGVFTVYPVGLQSDWRIEVDRQLGLCQPVPPAVLSVFSLLPLFHHSLLPTYTRLKRSEHRLKRYDVR